MHQVHLSDNLFKRAASAAKEKGFASVEEFVADALEQQLKGTSSPTAQPGEPAYSEQQFKADFDRVAEPLLALREQARADFKAGKTKPFPSELLLHS